MASLAPATPPQIARPTWRSGTQERAVLGELVSQYPRVVSRRELSRLATLTDLSARRCDSVLVTIRRTLGADSVITVRSRGWRLSPDAVVAAEHLLAQGD